MLYSQEERLSIKEYLAQKPALVWLVISILAICGFGSVSFGIYQLVSTNEQEIVSSNDIENQVCEQKADFGQVTVYISGAVTNPGVYVLESGDRVVDLLTAAGGLNKNADKKYVNKQFNFAERLSDGSQFYIPTSDEIEQQLAYQFEVNSEAKLNSSNVVSSPISINLSSKTELMKLSGIGEVRAEKIIESRPYLSIDDLVEKNIVSQSLFDEIKEKIEI